MSFKDRFKNENPNFNPQNKKADEEGFVISKEDDYGVLTELIFDKNIDKIFVNQDNVYVVKKGREYRANINFKNRDELSNIIHSLACDAEQNINTDDKFLDFKLNNGSRVIAVLPPYCAGSPVLSIEKVKDLSGTLESLIGLDCLSKEIALFLEAVINLNLNVVISGPQNSGKTTLLSAMIKKIDSGRKILSFEKIPEIKYSQEQVIRFCSSNTKDPLSLLETGLKFCPDKVVLSDCDVEIAGGILDILLCGSSFITTLDAKTSEDAIKKIKNMIQISEGEYSNKSLEKLIEDNIDVILQLKRFKDGKIRLVDVCFIDHRDEVSKLKRIFYWDYTDGIGGRFYSCGEKPNFLQGSGFEMSDLIFEREYTHTQAKNSESRNISDDIESQLEDLYLYSKGPDVFKKFKRK